VEEPQYRTKVADEQWLTKQSQDLLDIIKILYKGRDEDLKKLEQAQATMSSQEQIEKRIALINATVAQRASVPRE
jgi:hypothetical protein